MARVISWVIGDKYVYIEKQGDSWIMNERLSDTDTKLLGNRVIGWTETEYKNNFEAMYSAISNSSEFGGPIDMVNDYKYYFNATGGEGVYILTGRDGVDTSSQSKSPYNIQITNNNTCLGLGGDYKLDVAVTLKTYVRLEKDGEFYLPEQVVTGATGAETNWVSPTTVDGYSEVSVKIAKNTDFSGNNHVKEYWIRAKKDGKEVGKVLFTVVGVKDGEEGVSYDLLVMPNQINVSADGVPTDNSVTCKVIVNGEAKQPGGELKIKYDFGPVTTDVQDIEYEYSGSIPYSTISAKGDRVNFYLLFGNNLVDYDSCVVTRDGVDGGHVTFELDNEIDGVGVGSDSKLDVTEDVHLKTGFVMYSGSTELPLKSIKISDLGTPSSVKIVTNTGREITPVNNVFNLGSATGGVLHIYLKNGFEFGEDLRDAVTIDATGETNAGEVYASTIYTILGVKGGKDGEVYKIMTSHDSIVYDPNKTPRHSYGTSAYLTAKPYIGTEEIDGGNFTMSYTIDSIKTTKTGTITYTKGSNVDKLKIDKLVGSQSEDPAKYVVFYLWSGSTLVDRESVPVLGNGMNGSAVWVELSNEIDAISVGDDTDLDLEPGEKVHVGTTAMIMSGATLARIARVQVIPPAGTEANWNQYVEVNQVISDDNLSAKIDLYISNGFEFGDDYREVVTISATAEDGWQGSTQYVLKGIKGGKDGYVYRVVPETDYVTYNPNTASMDFGQGQITCTAYYGKDKIGTGDFTPQAPDGLYYSINKVCETSADTASDVSHFVTGFTSYPSGGVNLGSLVTIRNYKNFKYLVFYLLVDKEIVDRETVKIVSDGLDGHDNIRIELTNEIDSIGIGTDTILDLPDGETRKMSTGVMMYSGSTKLSIRQVRAEFANDSNSDPAHSSTGWSQSDETFTVTLKNGFDFGEDLKEKVVVYVTGGTATNPVAGYAAFVLAGILGGKDGVTYKIQPTPDCVMYDYETQGFPGLNLISAKAYSGGKLMEPGTFEIYYSEQVYDIDTVDLDEILIPYQNPLSFSAPVAGEDKRYVFYLKVGDVFVDRETVPLLVNGKEGRDYNGASIAPNLTDEMGVVALGNNERLEANVVLHTTYYIRNGYEKLTIGGITLPGTYTCPSGRGTIAFTSDFVAGTGQKDVDITITITASKTKYIDFARIVEGAKFNPITGFVIEGFPADVPECVLPVDYKIAGALGGEDGQTMGMVLSADQVFYDDTKVAGSRCTPTLIKAQLFLNGSDITMNSDVTFEVVSSVDASVVTGKWLSYSRKSGGFAEFNVTESKVESELIPLSIRVKKGGVVVDLESVQVVKNGKDGSGGLYSKVEPQSLFVPCEEGHPRSNYNGRVQISLWSGFTQDTIKRVTATSTYSAFGAKGASGKNVTYEVTDGDGLYKWFNVTATTAADFSNPIEIQLTFQSNTDTTLTRYGIVTLNPSEGGRGARGPMTRIRDFKSEYSYQNGSDTDVYLDIVVYYDGTGGGYYLCIKDQSAPSTAPKVKVVNGETVVDNTDTNWQYQPEAAFTASKVATFGTWPNGWVIDAGKIQHTQSGITLDADGIIKVGGNSNAGAIINGDNSIHASDDQNNTLMIAAGMQSVSKANEATFRVYKDGHLYAQNADISGKIQAERGSIGGLTIVDNGIASENGNFNLTSDGDLTVNSISINTESFSLTDNVYNQLSEFIGSSGNEVHIDEQLDSAIWSAATEFSADSIKGFTDPEFEPVLLTSYTVDAKQVVRIIISYEVSASVRIQNYGYMDDSDYMLLSTETNAAFSNGLNGSFSFVHSDYLPRIDKDNNYAETAFTGQVTYNTLQAPGNYSVVISPYYGFYKLSVEGFKPRIFEWAGHFNVRITSLKIDGIISNQGTEVFKNGFGLKSDSRNYFFTNRAVNESSPFLRFNVSTNRGNSITEQNELSLTDSGFKINSPIFTIGKVRIVGGSYTLTTEDELIIYRGNNSTITLPTTIPVGKSFKLLNWTEGYMGIKPNGGAAIFKPAYKSTSPTGIIKQGQTFGNPNDRHSYDIYRIEETSVNVNGITDEAGNVLGNTSLLCWWVINED